MLALQLTAEHWDVIVSYLTGISEAYEIFQCDTPVRYTAAGKAMAETLEVMAETLEVMCPLSKNTKDCVNQCHVIQAYQHLRETERTILEKICLEHLRKRYVRSSRGRQRYSCAFRGCQKEAGAWMPYSPGRGVVHLCEESYEGSIVCVGDSASGSPQELVEDFATMMKSWQKSHVLVTCSVKCHRRVKGYLHGLGGGMWRNIYVVRSTKQVPKKLWRAFRQELDQRDKHDMRTGNTACWTAVPGEYDEMVAKYDDESESELELKPKRRRPEGVSRNTMTDPVNELTPEHSWAKKPPRQDWGLTAEMLALCASDTSHSRNASTTASSDSAEQPAFLQPGTPVLEVKKLERDG